jgi:hypothetical protein
MSSSTFGQRRQLYQNGETFHLVNARDEIPPFDGTLPLDGFIDHVVMVLFFSQEGDPYDIYTRDFGPAVGIPEDSVTGAANGALAGYFVLEEMLNSEQRKKRSLSLCPTFYCHSAGPCASLSQTLSNSTWLSWQ